MGFIENFEKSNKILKMLEEIVPGASHTYSKGHDQFPELAPKIMSHAKGAYTWDVDDNRYIDWAMGNRVMVLGHSYDAVDNAVIEQIKKGTNFTKPGILEYELAEYLTELIPCAEMVKFGKNGSDVTTAAIKLARAYTGKKYIAVCRQHPFFSIHDWFIASTEMNAGIPDEVEKYTLKFDYNDIGSVEKIFSDYDNDIAAIILEPVKNDEPVNDFLQKIRDLCSKNNSILIFDEMISGMKFDIRGAHNMWGVYPDLATYGKAIANGYSFSLLAGKKEIMDLGGLSHSKPKVFLLSQTHSSETVGLAAARATLEECQRVNISKHIWSTGEELKSGFLQIALEKGISKNARMIGFDCNPQIILSHENGENWPALTTLFHQEMIKRGVLIPWITITYSHKKEEVDKTLMAMDESLDVIKFAIENNQVDKLLVGDSVKPVFRKYNFK